MTKIEKYYVTQTTKIRPTIVEEIGATRYLRDAFVRNVDHEDSHALGETTTLARFGRGIWR
jgi:hypothetical protein